MKEVTLTIEDEHYEIFKRFARLYSISVPELILITAKSSLSANLEAEDQGDRIPCRFDIDERLGGTRKLAALS